MSCDDWARDCNAENMMNFLIAHVYCLVKWVESPDRKSDHFDDFDSCSLHKSRVIESLTLFAHWNDEEE
jgi:hypothetical protein